MTIQDADTIDGIGPAIDKVLPWLKKFADSLDASDAEMTVKLVVVSKHDGEQVITEAVFDPNDDNLEDFVKELVDEAVEDVEDQKGSVRYGVRIEGREDRRTFVLKSKHSRKLVDGEEDDEESDEPANAKGQVGLALNQSYRMSKLSLSEARQNAELHRDMMKDLRQENAELRKAHRENLRVIERAHSEAQKRDLEYKKMENSEKRKDQIAEGLVRIGFPLLAAKFTGADTSVVMTALMTQMASGGAGGARGGPGPGGAASPSVRTSSTDGGLSLVDDFISSMDQPQFQELVRSELLRADQKAILIALVRARVEAKEAEEAAARASTNGATNGAAHASPTEGR